MATAQYPGSLKTYTDKVNVTEVIDASHPNALQAEVTAIESVLGYGVDDPRSAKGVISTAVWSASAQTWPSVGKRLDNIEKGVIGDSHDQYVHKKGGDTITPYASGVIGLKVQGASGQTANLTEWWAAGAGAPTTYIDASGNLNGVISSAVMTAKGDTIAGGSSGTPTRIPVGANGTVLTADSTQTAGVKWAAPVNQTIGFSLAFLTMGAC